MGMEQCHYHGKIAKVDVLTRSQGLMAHLTYLDLSIIFNITCYREQIGSRLGVDPLSDPVMSPFRGPKMSHLMDPEMSPLMNPEMSPLMNPEMNPLTNPEMSPLMDPEMSPLKKPVKSPLTDFEILK